MTDLPHDRFPIRLKGNRRAIILLPADLMPDDVALIQKTIAFIGECSVDYVAPAEPADQVPRVRDHDEKETPCK